MIFWLGFWFGGALMFFFSICQALNFPQVQERIAETWERDKFQLILYLTLMTLFWFVSVPYLAIKGNYSL